MPCRSRLLFPMIPPWKSRDANICHTRFRPGLTRKGKFISSPSTAKSVSGINSRCRMFPNVCLKPSVIGRKSRCGGHIYFFSCRTTCMRCFPFRHQANRCNWSSANGRNGQPKNWALCGSAIFLNIGCGMMKAVAKKRITFCKTPSVRNWSRARKNGRSFILVTASDRSLNGRDACHFHCPGRDAALRRPVIAAR